MADRNLFHKRYIRKEYDQMGNPSMLEGNLFHAVLKDYYSKPASFDIKQSLEVNINEFTDKGQFENINWGKTGSPEKSIKTVSLLVYTYFNETKKFEGEVEAVEQSYTAHIEGVDGDEKPVPIKGIIDLVMKYKGGYYLVDHKLVSGLHEDDEIIPAYEIQACAYYYLMEAVKGVGPQVMIFNEIKKSKNADKSPQVKRYTYVYTEDRLKAFEAVYDAIIEELKRGIIPMPNIADFLTATDSWVDYISQLKKGEKNESIT